MLRHLTVFLTSVLMSLSLPGCASQPGKFVTAPSPSEVAPSSAIPSAPPSPPPPAFVTGNPDGKAEIPAAARAEDTSSPTRVIGSGTPAGCTSEEVVKAVAAGGVITFNCGPDPVTITMKATAKVRNANPRLVLDGGGKVTLSGGGSRRILYMSTCDKAQGWTTSHCNDQENPRMTVQNIAFVSGNATGQPVNDLSGNGDGGGGAIFVRGGQLKVVNALFKGNKCDPTGPDLGGAAIRALDIYRDGPVYVVNSTFEDGSCSNGSGLSSIGVSWVVLNSLFRNNNAIGRGANPARAGTPGGGSGGAIYLDGNLFTLKLSGCRIENNVANEGGGAVFFVSNNRTGTMAIENSVLHKNPSKGFQTKGFPGIFFLGARPPSVTGSKLD